MTGVTLDKLKDLSILIPAIHIVMCFSYLLFYYMSFGYGIHIFSSPVDVFAISLGELLPIYIFLALGSVIGIGQGKLFISFARDLTDDEIESIGESKLSRFLAVSKGNPHMFIALVGGSVFVLLALLSVIIFYARTGFLHFTFANIVLIFGWVVIDQFFVRRSGLNKIQRELIFYGGFALIMTVSAGLHQGQMDRHLAYSQLESNNPKCEELIVLRSLSDRFLAVDKDNTRLIIDEECKPVFTLFDSSGFQKFPAISVYDLIRT
ncbi:hypothetical protein [Sphingorhabdus sp. EL138]|uniref:hypothetical protein n=1 Tax=Sphingorhabdus sp. EL138 TaxID=2073156 RepID=UPI000D68D557|nr:hypothetical protein [Sphingorhabdus sp. EL138]